MSENIVINSVKINKDETAIIEYAKTDDTKLENITHSGVEKVTLEFSKIFQENIKGFLGCLPNFEKSANKLTMNVIKFNYDKEKQLTNALYSVKYNFNDANNAVVNISTPRLPIFKEEFDEKTFCISGKDIDNLLDVIECAKRYINGETGTKQLKIVD